MYNVIEKLINANYYPRFKSDLDRSTKHPKFDPTGVQTHDLWIMAEHFMTLKDFK